MTYLKHAARDLQDGHIECAATQVVDGNDFTVGFVHTVGECCGGGLVDDTVHLKTCDTTSILNRNRLNGQRNHTVSGVDSKATTTRDIE